jgi:cytoskeleton protein RodZ
MTPRAHRELPADDESANTMAKPWEGEGGSFGSWLRQQREIRNITLREISDNTKIGLRYLEALEEDRFEVLPAPIFAKGFLREYAKYVGLDPDEVVNFYLTAEQRHRAERGGDDVSGVLPIPNPGRVPPARGLPLGWLLIAAAALLALLLVAALVWALRRGRGAERLDPAAETTAEATPMAPVPMAPAPGPPPPAPPQQAPAGPHGPLVVTLSFTAECWVEAVVDRDRHISELRVQGESMRIEGRESVVLTLGNAGAVRGEVNGRPLRLGATPGQVVRDLLIDRAMAGLPPLPASSPAPPA